MFFYRGLGLVLLFLMSCDNSTVSPEPPVLPPQISPPTISIGPGGPGYMQGFIGNEIFPNLTVTNTMITLVNPENYSDTLHSFEVLAESGNFLLTDLPTDSIDIIVKQSEYFDIKIPSWSILPIGNSFNFPGSQGYFRDSTLYMVALADSVDRPDAPVTGILGYGNGLVVQFKPGIMQAVGDTIIDQFTYTTLRVSQITDPITFQTHLTYYIIYPVENKILHKSRIKYFVNRKEVSSATASLAFINP